MSLAGAVPEGPSLPQNRFELPGLVRWNLNFHSTPESLVRPGPTWRARRELLMGELKLLAKQTNTRSGSGQFFAGISSGTGNSLYRRHADWQYG